MSGAAEARAVLRCLLRAVDRNVTCAAGNHTWRDFVLAEFRRGEALEGGEERAAALREARDYAYLVNSVREHKVGWSKSFCLPELKAEVAAGGGWRLGMSQAAAAAASKDRTCRRRCAPFARPLTPSVPRYPAHRQRRTCCCLTTSASPWISGRGT